MGETVKKEELKDSFEKLIDDLKEINSKMDKILTKDDLIEILDEKLDPFYRKLLKWQIGVLLVAIGATVAFGAIF